MTPTPTAAPADSQFATGATRSGDANHLDFMSISPIAMIALARTCQEGGEKYGYHNWEQGMDTIDLLNHVKRHLTLWEAGDRSEPHLPHALWGLHAAVHMDTLHPELSAARRRGPGCSLTPAMRAHLDANKAGLAEKRKAGVFARLGAWTMAGVAEVAAILKAAASGGAVERTDVASRPADARVLYRGLEVAPIDRTGDVLGPVSPAPVGSDFSADPSPSLRDRLADNFDAAGITDRDIFDEEDEPAARRPARSFLSCSPDSSDADIPALDREAFLAALEDLDEPEPAVAGPRRDADNL